MTKRRTIRSRAVRRAAVVLAAAIGVSTVASTAGNAAPAPSAKTGGKINVGIFNQFPGWCVNNNPANSALMGSRTVYETLFEKDRRGTLRPLLAQSARANSAKTEWTIKLRPGIKFHDGELFNADAVVTNLKVYNGLEPFEKTWVPTYLKSGGKLPVASLADQQKALLAAQTTLATAAHLIGTAAAFTANISGIAKVDDLTVKITLSRPQADLPGSLFASGRFYMRSPKAFANKDICTAGRDSKGNSFGTGPFKMKSWTPNKLVVVKNTGYWRKDAQGIQLPYLDQITFTYVAEPSQRVNGARSGKFDAVMFSSESEATQIKTLRKVRTQKEYKTPNEFYPSIFLNQAKADSPFSNKNARLAVQTCIDRANYVKVRLAGEGEPANSLVGPKSVMYTKSGFQPFNVAKAKAYVAAYKKETGKSSLTFTFPVTESTTAKRNARFIEEQWKKCGIRAQMKNTTVLAFLADIFDTSTGKAENKYDAVYITVMEGTDVSFNLPFLLTNSFPATSKHPAAFLYRDLVGPILGLSYHKNTTVDRELFAGQAKTNGRTNFRKATATIQREALVVPVVRFYYSFFAGPKLDGIGKLPIASKALRRVTSNYGIDWTGVYIK